MMQSKKTAKPENKAAAPTSPAMRQAASEQAPMPEMPVCERLQTHPDLLTAVQEKLPDREEQLRLADLFRMFGDPTRIQLLSALLVSEMCVCDLSQLLGVTVSAVSHQLRLLKTAGLVTYRREGKNVIYALADDHVRTILACGVDHIRE